MKKKLFSLVSILALSITVNSGCQSLIKPKGPHFERTGDMHYPRAGHTANLLKDGTVLIVGGGGCSKDIKSDCYRSAEIYDPRTGQFKLLAAKLKEIHEIKGGAAPQLSDGRLVFIGLPGTHAEIYDPKTQTFSLSTTMAVIPRLEHSMAVLNDNRVLIMGGKERRKYPTNGLTWEEPVDKAEIFDPESDKFTLLKSKLHHEFAYPKSISLPNGDVLIVDNVDWTVEAKESDADEIYNASQNRFEKLTEPIMSRSQGALLLLKNGKVLIIGGGGNHLRAIPVQFFDPVKKHFTSGSHPELARELPLITELSNGRVFLSGGSGGGFGAESIKNTAQLYDPITDIFEVIPNMMEKRVHATVTKLLNGDILITGGVGYGASKTAEIFKLN